MSKLLVDKNKNADEFITLKEIILKNLHTIKTKIKVRRFLHIEI